MRKIKLVAMVVLWGIVFPVALRWPHVGQNAETETCSMNLKMIALALHNDHSGFDSFPSATIHNPALKPDQRMSWYIATMPFMFCYHCWGLDDLNHVDHTKLWDQGPQASFSVLTLDPLVCPASKSRSHGTYSSQHYLDRTKLTTLIATEYIGIAGVGIDARSFPKANPKAGVFGDDRWTTLTDIEDGVSTTMMVAETSDTIASWTAGRRNTVRGLDPARLPYIGKTHQFGGNHGASAQILFVDRSVRTLRNSIDPKVFEAMATMAGGEQVPKKD